MSVVGMTVSAERPSIPAEQETAQRDPLARLIRPAIGLLLLQPGPRLTHPRLGGGQVGAILHGKGQ